MEVKCDYCKVRDGVYEQTSGKMCCEPLYVQCPSVKKRKTWDEQHGKEKADEMRKVISKKLSGKNNGMYGKPKVMSEESKILISKSLTGRPSTTKGKTWDVIYGKEKADEMRRNMSEKNKGKNNPIYGKTRIVSDETKKLMSLSRRGKPNGRKGKTWEDQYGKEKADEMRKEMSEKTKGKNNPMYGTTRIMSKETRKLMSKSQQGRTCTIKGKTWDEFYGEEKADEMRKEMSEKTKGKNNPMYGKKRIISKETRKKMADGNRLTIEKINKRYPFFSQIEEMRYNPDKTDEKEIQVHCKNYECTNSKEKGGWFTPNRYQMSDRIVCVEKNGTDLSNFYCCQECKDSCPLHGARSDSYKAENTILSYTEAEYKVWRTEVFSRATDGLCEICGKEQAVHAHHIKPKKLEPFFALDPDYGIALCEKCHFEKGHPKDTECSIGNIIKKKCNNNNQAIIL